MRQTIGFFGSIFKKLRLRSGIATLSELGDLLGEKGYVIDESLFSRWQRGDRLPRERRIILMLIDIFAEKDGITSLNEANLLLNLAHQPPLNKEESALMFNKINRSIQFISPDKLLKFFLITARSKRLVRTGWKREHIDNPESVAEHSFQLSIMAMIFANQLGVDTEKLIKMAIVHDLGELVTGDIVWTRGKIMDIEKRVIKEKDELEGIISIFGNIDKSSDFRTIFEEMIERRSEEAKVFWQLDKVEMSLQALIYEQESGKNLDEFFLNSNLQIYTPLLRDVFSLILKKRPRKRTE